ncbi:MAG: hypothetical protein ACKOWG_04965 [Planctomycetia bacterium]
MQEPERTSRQDLVVPPRQSNLPLMLGAILCAGCGFGLVWALGIGRTPAGGESTAPAYAGVPDDETAPPQVINERDWRPAASPAAVPADPERYPTRPATLETPVDIQPMPTTPPDGRTSRFTAPGRFPGTGDEPIRLASAEAAASDAEPAIDPVDAAPTATDASDDDLLPPPAETSDPAPAAPAPPATFSESEPAIQPPPLPPSPAPDAGGDLLQEPPTPLPPAAPTASAPAAPRRFTTPDLAAPPASFRPAAVAPAAPAPPSPVVGVTATNPFASAPPMGPTPQQRTVTGAVGGGPLQPGAAAGTTPEAMGQGRPGAMQLEGLQTPQLAVEKRGPRENQVGKPVRYELLSETSARRRPRMSRCGMPCLTARR